MANDLGPSGIGGVRIGIVATRLGGTDGVSLEAEAWARTLRGLGHQIYAFAGLFETPYERSREVPLAFFGHPRVVSAQEQAYSAPSGQIRDVASAIGEIAAELEGALREFVRDAGLELLIAENTLSLPIHLPLGLALTRLVASTGLPVLAHHHDLPWERQRFVTSGVQDVLGEAFPPALANVHHVCINTQQRWELGRRGYRARVIPNTVEVGETSGESVEGARLLRASLGVRGDESFVLQPTRVVPRKGIEHALELIRRLDRPAKLVVSGGWGDEGRDYGQHIEELARLLGVQVIWAADRVAAWAGTTSDGARVYSLDEAFQAADLVTYPSQIEGFGRAFLAAARHRRPIVVNRYPVYDLDLRPLGFKVVEMEGFVSEDTVTQSRRLLDDPQLRADWGDHNYELVRRHFSADMLERELDAALAGILGRERTATTRPAQRAPRGGG